MIRSAVVLLTLVLAATCAGAQGAAPDGENGRFSFSPVAEGLLMNRFDVARAHVMQPPYVVKPPNEGSSNRMRCSGLSGV